MHPSDTISYNQWTTVPESHAGIRHTTAESEFTFPLAVARWKQAAAGEAAAPG